MLTEGAAQTPEDRDAPLWAQFAEAATTEAYCASWLGLQCRLVEGVVDGLVLLRESRGPYVPAAVWPDPRRSVQYLVGAAERALTERRGVLLRPDPEESGGASPPAVQVACPIQLGGEPHGVAVLGVLARPDALLQKVLRQLYWGSAWLEVLLRRGAEEALTAERNRLATALDLVGACVEQERFRPAATAFVTEVASRLQCERVSFGALRGRRVRVWALSHSADFGPRTDLIQALASAMEEAIDQQSVVLYPEEASQPLVTRAHAELARRHDAGALCTVPLAHGDACFGALTLERPAERPFDAETVELCESLAAVVGPILAGKQREDRPLATKALLSLRDVAAKLFGPRHLGWKVAAVTAAGLVAWLSTATGDYRVTAGSAIEGAVQRSIVAPFEGYIAAAEAKAGDVVAPGEVLALLDDRDLTLERVKWLGQKDELSKKYREALGKYERAQVRIVGAQIEQADAQIALLTEKLARTRVTAPFRGLVVSGDLSQSLGAPVEKGRVLFQVAPLDAYRVIVEVDEKDVAAVAEGQTGELVLSAFPGETLPLTVEKVTPVATAGEGRNFFRVEARLRDAPERLRPGMEGVAKLFIGRRSLFWIWTHDVLEEVRLWLWSWRP